MNADERQATRSSMDDVIDLYKRDVDRTLLREALKLSPSERLAELIELNGFAEAVSTSGRSHLS